jgi:hypothetical protein
MIGRRTVIAGACCTPLAAAFAALPVPPSRRLCFDVIRHGDKIGEHAVTFDVADRTVHVAVACDISVYFGPIRVFRYRHRSREAWQDGQVASIESHTDNDGGMEVMTALRGDQGLVTEGTKAPRYVAPARSLPGSHWNPAMLDAPFINTQDGRLMAPEVTPAGTGHVPCANGTITVRRFVLRGGVELETWYDLAGNWDGLRFAGRDGSEVSYRRTSPLVG